MSSPSSNNIMLVGCIFCLISVQLFGLDGQDIGIDYFEVVCNVCLFVYGLFDDFNYSIFQT